jgi:hypothetical protein
LANDKIPAANSDFGTGELHWQGRLEGAAFDPDVFLATLSHGRTTIDYQTGQLVFSQGDLADAVFYIACGKIKIFVTSRPTHGTVVNT